MTDIKSEDTWDVVASFIRDEGIIKYINSSYNDFVCKLIPDTINASNEMIFKFTTDQETVLEIVVKLRNPQLSRPVFNEQDGTIRYNITPNECRLRKLHYMGNLNVDVNIKINKYEENSDIKDDNNKKLIYENNENILLCELPIMVQSNFCSVKDAKIENFECEKDYGGYFIINGSEKIVIGQERMTNNEIYIFSNKTDCLQAEIKSSDFERKLLTSFYLYYLYPNRKINKVVRTQLQFIKKEVKLAILFKALGVTEHDQINSMISRNDTDIQKTLSYTLEEDTDNILTQDDALEYIGQRASQGSSNIREKNIQNARYILTKTFIPHTGPDFPTKAYFLSEMTRQLLKTSLGKRANGELRDFDDRDHYGNKRVDLVGELLHLIFQRGFDKMYKDLQITISRIAKKKLSNISSYGKGECFNINFSINSLLNNKIITKELTYALATGNWGNTKTGASKSGVSQVASRLNLLSMYSQIRRLTTPSGKNSTTSKPRQLHNTQWGLVCSNETPEGASCGFNKNMAFLSHVSLSTSTDCILNALDTLDILPFDSYPLDSYPLDSRPLEEDEYTSIWLNGRPIGFVTDCDTTFDKLKKYKLQNIIPLDITIYYNYKENQIKIWTDSGRCSRPLFVVENNKLLITSDIINQLKSNKLKWRDLFIRGYVEYLDAKESENSVIATYPEDLLTTEYTYTHCEINPSSILGVIASVIPFPDRQPAPRTTYETGMAKQSMGVNSTAFKYRMDTNSHVLWYSQKSLAPTRQYKMLNLDDLSTETNCVVAICSYYGWDQEDGIILNQSSIDRGLFRSSYLKTYCDIENKSSNNTVEEFFSKGDDKRSCKLDYDGIVNPGTKLVDEDRIVNKVISNIDEKGKRKNIGVDIHKIENAVVDKVMLTNTDKGQKMCKVALRMTKIPEIGDKFASKFAQKGTCCMIARQEDMPFDKDGICPDIIINPLCIPSRGTLGHLIEALFGKYACLSGEFQDSTAFNLENNPQRIGELLQSRYGYSHTGKDRLIDGITGKQMLVDTYIGVNHYHRLKHLVSEKHQSRARGPSTLLTRQPIEGRSKDGSLRYGEMEATDSVAKGTSITLREKLLTVSDKYEVNVCNMCKMIAFNNQISNTPYCKGCDNEIDISKVQIPYACKLLFQELMGMGISCKINVKNNDEFINIEYCEK